MKRGKRDYRIAPTAQPEDPHSATLVEVRRIRRDFDRGQGLPAKCSLDRMYVPGGS